MVRWLFTVGVLIGLLSMPLSALAAKPITETHEFSAEVVLTDLCDFPLHAEVTGVVHTTTHMDKNGNITRVFIKSDVESTLTNLDSGTNYTLTDSGQYSLRPSPPEIVDEEAGTVTYHSQGYGKYGQIVVPGTGVVSLLTGQFDLYTIFTLDGEFVDEIVVLDVGHETFDLPALCGLVA